MGKAVVFGIADWHGYGIYGKKRNQWINKNVIRRGVEGCWYLNQTWTAGLSVGKIIVMSFWQTLDSTRLDSTTQWNTHMSVCLSATAVDKLRCRRPISQSSGGGGEGENTPLPSIRPANPFTKRPFAYNPMCWWIIKIKFISGRVSAWVLTSRHLP